VQQQEAERRAKTEADSAMMMRIIGSEVIGLEFRITK
jgi:hypothetical protein